MSNTQDKISPQSKLAEVKQGLHPRLILHSLFRGALQQKCRHILRHISTEHAENMRPQSGEKWSKNTATISWLSSRSASLSDVPLPCPSREGRRLEIVCRGGWGHIRQGINDCTRNLRKHRIKHSQHEKGIPRSLFFHRQLSQVRAQLIETEHILKAHPGLSHQWD